jgi:hypothetical protein
VRVEVPCALDVPDTPLTRRFVDRRNDQVLVGRWVHDPTTDFWEKAADVCGLYLNPPENAIVWSVD